MDSEPGTDFASTNNGISGEYGGVNLGLTKDEIRAKKKVAAAEAELSAALQEQELIIAWQQCFKQPTCPFCGHHRNEHLANLSIPRILAPRRGRKTGTAFLHAEALNGKKAIQAVGCRTCGGGFGKDHTICYQRPYGNDEIVNRTGISEEEIAGATEMYAKGHRGPS